VKLHECVWPVSPVVFGHGRGRNCSTSRPGIPSSGGRFAPGTCLHAKQLHMCGGGGEKPGLWVKMVKRKV